ncbi:hypothetical protein [Terriglobus roseus]|uniref:Uncharacterized protein n=1 Tax=Terriglobus roseus TaxID=392734 RepID=A0A1H4IXR6_9BACT|nr:hypothetical protein [Terriglobus roseus]SEB38803.1 hypothetical protein SAMN05443244_0183 [Terriglobus roseus]
MPNISPRLVKGALVLLEPNTGIPMGRIALQYNPETITRSLKPQTPGEEPDRSELLRLKGPPVETIRLTVELDATDSLEAGDATATSVGLQPQMALLETLLYPSSTEMIVNEILSLIGTIEILPMSSPLTLLAWGTNRVTPVRITGFEITEEAFDAQLNPIRAKIALDLRVLSVSDAGFLSPVGAVYMAYQMGKEAMARRA